MSITDLKEAQRALDEFRARFAEFSEDSSDWLWEMDAELRFTYITDSVRRYNGGMDPSIYYGKDHREVGVPDGVDPDKWERHVADLEARRPFRNFQYINVDPDGNRHHWSVSGKPIQDPAGTFLGYRGVGRDITEQVQVEEKLRETNAQLQAEIGERRQAEAALRVSERRIADILENLPMGTGIARNSTGTVAFSNSRLRELFRLREEDVVGGIAADYHADPGERSRLLAELDAGGTVRDRETRMRRADGSEFWALSTLVPLEFEGAPALLGCFYDITERKHAEAALERSRGELAKKTNMLKGAFRSMNVGIAAFDKELNLVAWSEHYLEIRDYPPDLAREGRHFSEFTRHDVERYEFGEGDPDEIIDRVVNQAYNSQPRHFERLRPDGRWIEVSGGPIEGGGFVSTYADITERKAAEDRLREGEERLTLALRGGDLGFWDINLATGNIVANERWAEMLGYRLDEVDDLREVAKNSFHPDDADRVNKYNRRHNAGEFTDYEIEYRIITKQGETRWQLSKGSTVKEDEQGRALRAVGTVMDITERKQTEEALATKEAQLRVAMDSMSGGIMMLDKDFTIVLFNDQCSRLFDFPEGLLAVNESLKKILKYQAERGDFGEGDVDELIEDVLFSSRPSEPKTFERQLTTGRIHEIGFAPTPDGGMVNVYNDITERKAAEEKIRESRVQLRKILDSSPFGITIVRHDIGERIYSNPIFNRMMTGDMERSMVGGDVASSYVDPEVYKKSIDLLRRHHGYKDLEEQRKRLDGTTWWSSVTARHLPSRGDDTYIFWHEDVTERRLAVTELGEAKAKAESATKAKSVFLANMSHEIRTPLNAILGYAQLMRRDPSLAANQQNILKIVNRSGEHLLGLINEILDMSKIEAGAMTLTANSFDLPTLLDEIRAMFTAPAEDKKLELEIDFTPDLPRHILTDEAKLRQILINLIGNAIKFTEKETISVAAKRDPHWSPNGDEEDTLVPIVITVADSGPGIPVENLERIFVPFEQTERGAQTGGTGLGLAISRQFARMLGGDITVTSTLGEGSCFRVTLLAEPGIVDETAGRAVPRRAIGLREGQGDIRVLVVDDQENNRDILVRMLEPLGFTTAQAPDGAEAVAYCAKEMPRVVMMDVVMANMDGIEATRRIRALPNGDAVAIIMVTASAIDEQVQKALKMGTDMIVVKPFREHQIHEAIHRHGGVEFIFEEMVSTGDSDGESRPDVSARNLEVLPSDLVEELRQAVVVGRLGRLGELVERVMDFDAALALAMDQAVSSFDMTTLKAVLLEEGDE